MISKGGLSHTTKILSDSERLERDHLASTFMHVLVLSMSAYRMQAFAEQVIKSHTAAVKAVGELRSERGAGL